jgi:predicted MFS family arabinose efflux permease
MIDTLGFSPSQMTYAYGFISLPWCLKPLYGFFTDSYSVFDWGKRRPYISFSGILTAFCYVYIPHFMTSGHAFVFILTLISFLVCFSDVCADSITVELEKQREVKGNVQTSCWISRALGTTVGALVGGVAYKNLGAIAVYRITAITPILMSTLIWNMKRSEGVSKNVCKDLYKNICEQKVLILLFLFVSLPPSYGVFYSYYLKRHMNYTPTDFAWINISSSLSYLLSVVFYKKFLLNYNKSAIILTGIIGSTCLRLTQLLVVAEVLPYFSIVLLDSIAESFFDQLQIMPLIVITASACKDGVEGTVYALMMSVSNFSNFLSTESGGFVGQMFGITENKFDNLFMFMFILIIADLIFPILALIKIPSYFSYYWEEKYSNHNLEPNDPEELVHQD